LQTGLKSAFRSHTTQELAQGAATEMLDAKEIDLELRRDGQRNLQQIATPNGHTIKFNYDDLSRIIRAEDDKGNWVKYSYNGEGMLESATFSSGQMRRYDYIGALMTAVMDEKGTVLVRNSYESELLTRQQFAMEIPSDTATTGLPIATTLTKWWSPARSDDARGAGSRFRLNISKEQVVSALTGG